jgi:hypothetical protein
MTKEQLFALLEAMERLPAAHVPLDAVRARELGVPTSPDEAFAGAVEAFFLFTEQPHPDMSVIEALLSVMEDVTGSPGSLLPLLRRPGRPRPPPMIAPPAPPPPPPPKRKKGEKHAPIVPPKSAAELLLATPEGEWVTGDVIDRSGPAAYTHLIRAADDPEEGARGKGKRDPLGWKKTVKKGDLAEWRKRILDLLAKHGPSTYNALSVHATGLTADITFEELPDKALWSLVSDGLVEHTMASPILFRLTARRRGSATECK